MPVIQHHTFFAPPLARPPNPYHRYFISVDDSSTLTSHSLATTAEYATASTPIHFDDLALLATLFVLVVGTLALVYLGCGTMVMILTKRSSRSQGLKWKRKHHGPRRQRESERDSEALCQPVSRRKESDSSSLWSSDAEWRTLQGNLEERRPDYGTSREEPRRETGAVEGSFGSEMGAEMSEVRFPGERLGMHERRCNGFGRSWTEAHDEEDGNRWVERALNDERRAAELMSGEGIPSDVI